MGRRKHVTQQSLQEEVQPPTDGQQIVRAVELPDGSKTLVLLPARFNKKLWVRRGGFLIVDQEPSGGSSSGGGKTRVTGSIASVLFPADVAALQRLGCWPNEFETQPAAAGGEKVQIEAAESAEGSGSDSDDELPPLVSNSNRPVIHYVEEDSSDED